MSDDDAALPGARQEGAVDLAALEAQARRTDAFADWRRLCRGLVHEGEWAAALSLLRQLTVTAAADEGSGPPGDFGDREHGEREKYGEHEKYGKYEAEVDECLLLAQRIASGQRLFAYADHMMHRLARSADRNARLAARDNLTASARRRRAEQEDRRLRELQHAYLREKIAALSRPDAHLWLRFARLTLKVGERDRMGSRLAATAAVLREGLEQAPTTCRCWRTTRRSWPPSVTSRHWTTPSRGWTNGTPARTYCVRSHGASGRRARTP
ncbi:hypothetical protein AB0D71_13735 [Streptomyces avermitilis]|uniref:hypothetical protein n=1 Tax=Streptomyces avermitilis TaxID=33903 RepID=UPI0033F554E4